MRPFDGVSPHSVHNKTHFASILQEPLNQTGVDLQMTTIGWLRNTSRNILLTMLLLASLIVSSTLHTLTYNAPRKQTQDKV